ncbi:interleukin-22 [Electrophorus electricus]|uniref:Interleukin 22 n=1 Tax=Electrophorus electricus TaxID=8005 RepID=A0A4W4DMJ7_ELEEL|nr:interleukin-22 [Electrophorus electricus]
MKCIAILALICAYLLSGTATPVLRTVRHRPRPLDNSETWNNVIVMAKHAQARDRDHETRLIPEISSDKLKAGNVCCINARILDYYLSDILHADQIEYPRLHLVKPDLKRVARDLKPHCNSNRDDKEYLQQFRQNLERAAEMYKNKRTATNKAIGETDILFHYLYESCTSVDAEQTTISADQ